LTVGFQFAGEPYTGGAVPPKLSGLESCTALPTEIAARQEDWSENKNGKCFEEVVS
jgi:hypothetical protein